jgi:hypothetical protein
MGRCLAMAYVFDHAEVCFGCCGNVFTSHCLAVDDFFVKLFWLSAIISQYCTCGCCLWWFLIILWCIDPLLGNDLVNIPAEVYAHSDRTSIARHWISKQAFWTIETLCFVCGPCWGDIKGQRKSFESVVENWVELWRWQLKMIEKKTQEMN